MNIKENLYNQLMELYDSESGEHLLEIGQILKPDIKGAVQSFYKELLLIDELSPFLEQAIIQKNLPRHLEKWFEMLFVKKDKDAILKLIERQQSIGRIHANINIRLSFFNHGASVLKRNIYQKLESSLDDPDRIAEYVMILSRLFDILFYIISDSYHSKEIVHETNEMSLRVKGITQNTAIECERLRSMLLDWLRKSLLYLYQAPPPNMENLPTLLSDNFGLWVVYKSDLMGHSLDISSPLKQHIGTIDQFFSKAAEARLKSDEKGFSDSVSRLNESVTQTSWFITSIVDQVLELDTGMDPLTRLFNRRYLDTILRRQTDISIKQGFPYSVLIMDLDFFKRVNDNYGHESGDMVLKQFAEMLLMSVRTSDFAFRHGGEEFLVILGNVESRQALEIAEKIRKKCESQKFKITEKRQIFMTCSIGVVTHGGHPDYNSLVKTADEALYRATAEGRNRVVQV